MHGVNAAISPRPGLLLSSAATCILVHMQVNSDAPTYQTPAGVNLRPRLATGSQQGAGNPGKTGLGSSSKARSQHIQTRCQAKCSHCQSLHALPQPCPAWRATATRSVCLLATCPWPQDCMQLDAWGWRPLCPSASPAEMHNTDTESA